jgi:hypothetical protein
MATSDKKNTNACEAAVEMKTWKRAFSWKCVGWETQAASEGQPDKPS